MKKKKDTINLSEIKYQLNKYGINSKEAEFALFLHLAWRESLGMPFKNIEDILTIKGVNALNNILKEKIK